MLANEPVNVSVESSVPSPTVKLKPLVLPNVMVPLPTDRVTCSG